MKLKADISIAQSLIAAGIRELWEETGLILGTNWNENISLIPENWKNNNLNDKWTKLFKIKQEANIAIEEKRSNKEIGSSLEAEIKIIADESNFNLLEGLDLAEYFITSKAEKIKSDKKNEIKIEVTKTDGNKCPRCWKILEKKCQRCTDIK